MFKTPPPPPLTHLTHKLINKNTQYPSSKFLSSSILISINTNHHPFFPHLLNQSSPKILPNPDIYPYRIPPLPQLHKQSSPKNHQIPIYNYKQSYTVGHSFNIAGCLPGTVLILNIWRNLNLELHGDETKREHT
ncbi:hypothetical protein OCU04_010266 [Sclerotinia nivalis]|uniref:Uncharacterized protein n=1 Tax=Sclerotinia nivalis TaxID=352851 RepID=A0A9X0AFD7_9HELO|nr:hypothetical protein OCU04_010266 [Sclerotinia nivalis]